MVWYFINHNYQIKNMNTAIRSSNRKKLTALPSLVNDMKACARAVHLVYVSDSETGIIRSKKGKGFIYTFNNKTITDEQTLKRIRSLVIPPAWRNVWICPDEKGHLQATGLDIKNRKQYRYHPQWNSVRNHTKFSNLLEFGECLPQIREQLAKDIAQTDLSERKVLALVISLMDQTYIRIGNSYYEKTNGSHGLTTLKDKHVVIDGSSVTFSFKGKKGVYHEVSIKNKKLARLVKQCRDIPGKELFQYIGKDGVRKCIDSGMVNNYIKEITQKQFTAKDFRTWAGTLNALRKLTEMGYAENDTNCKKNLVSMFDFVSQKLGNTRTVCKKYYVHPVLLDLYEKKCLPDVQNFKPANSSQYFTTEEQLLMEILKCNSKTEHLVLAAIVKQH
jgi:DNA topoisomerase I